MRVWVMVSWVGHHEAPMRDKVSRVSDSSFRVTLCKELLCGPRRSLDLLPGHVTAASPALPSWESLSQ